MRNNIMKCEVKFPEIISVECKDLLLKLLEKNQNKRLGYTSKLTSDSSADIILSHPWFKGISLKSILSKSLIPQRPYLKQTLQECVECMSPKEQAVIKSINSNLQEQIKSQRKYSYMHNKIEKWTFINNE